MADKKKTMYVLSAWKENRVFGQIFKEMPGEELKTALAEKYDWAELITVQDGKVTARELIFGE